MLRLALSVFLVLMLASPWQFAPPTEPDGMDGQISNPSMFVPPAAAAKAYLVTELGNIFPVEDVTTGQAPINNQGQANHTDAIGLALGQAIVGSGMYLKSVKTPAEYTLVYHGDGQVTTVPLVPYTRLPSDADFAMVYPSGQEIIEINVTRFDAGYSRYDSYNQVLVQTAPSYPEVFRHTGTMQTNVTGMTVYRVDPSLYDRSVYMTTNATDPGFSVTFATSDVDPFSDWVHDRGYPVFDARAYNYTDIDYDRYYRGYHYGYAVNYANLSSSPGVTFHITDYGNLNYEAQLTSYNRVTEEVEYTPGMCYTNTDYVDDAPAMLDPRNRDFTLNFIGPANATTIESFYESNISYRYHYSQHNSCPGPAIDRERTVDASLEVWDRGFRHVALLQINGTGSHALTVPYPYNGPLYMVAGPEPVDISMIEFDPARDRFSVGGLPGNVPYVISDDDGNDVGAGVTSGSGSISKTLGSISRDMEPGDGGVLRLYPGAPHYDGYINVVSFDMRNNARVDNHQGSNTTFAYVPVIYARLAFIADAQVDHVTLKSKILGDINMDHLAGSYIKNQALMVPILPGATSLDMTINGFDMSVLISDMRVEEGPGFIVKETNSHEFNTRGNRVSASSAATSNAFAIATSNGTMTADVTVWLTGDAEMSLTTIYEIGVDRNKRYTHSWTWLSTWISAWDYSLYYWGIKRDGETLDELRDWAADALGYPLLSEIREDQRTAQWEINRNYRDSVEQNLESTRSPGIVAVVSVYKNGELVKTVPLTGAGLPVTTTSHSVSGLPTTYWPPGTINSVGYQPEYPSRAPNRAATYDALAAITIHQEADISYQSSTPQALVEVEVDTGDMIGFVVQARLGTSGISAPSLVDYTVDPRLHVNSTSITSTGHGEATVTIEGGSINIFCCSE